MKMHALVSHTSTIAGRGECMLAVLAAPHLARVKRSSISGAELKTLTGSLTETVAPDTIAALGGLESTKKEMLALAATVDVMKDVESIEKREKKIIGPVLDEWSKEIPRVEVLLESTEWRDPNLLPDSKVKSAYDRIVRSSDLGSEFRFPYFIPFIASALGCMRGESGKSDRMVFSHIDRLITEKKKITKPGFKKRRNVYGLLANIEGSEKSSYNALLAYVEVLKRFQEQPSVEDALLIHDWMIGLLQKETEEVDAPIRYYMKACELLGSYHLGSLAMIKMMKLLMVYREDSSLYKKDVRQFLASVQSTIDFMDLAPFYEKFIPTTEKLPDEIEADLVRDTTPSTPLLKRIQTTLRVMKERVEKMLILEQQIYAWLTPFVREQLPVLASECGGWEKLQIEEAVENILQRAELKKWLSEMHADVSMVKPRIVKEVETRQRIELEEDESRKTHVKMVKDRQWAWLEGFLKTQEVEKGVQLSGLDSKESMKEILQDENLKNWMRATQVEEKTACSTIISIVKNWQDRELEEAFRTMQKDFGRRLRVLGLWKRLDQRSGRLSQESH